MRNTLFLTCLLCMCTTLLFSQKKSTNDYPIFKKVEKAKSQIAIPEFSLVTASSRNLNSEEIPSSDLREGVVIDLDLSTISTLRAQNPDAVQLTFPLPDRQNVQVNLLKNKVLTPDFILRQSANNNEIIDYTPGLYYIGVVEDDPATLVSISVFENEIIGSIFTDHGNYVIGKLENSRSNKHIIYNDKDLEAPFDLDCGTRDDGQTYRPEDLTFDMSRAAGDCVRIYVEIDNDIVNQKGGATAATNYITGLMNQVILLYAADDLAMVVSEIKAWTTTSPYSSNSSSGMLSDFQANTGTFNGDLAHLMSYQASGGIAAGFSGICASNPDNSKCFSSIDASFSNIPTFSWSVMVVTHEMGHLIGSRHTHACVWNGNNTAIDGCAGSTEGSCSNPGNPSGGGTIMSYCHLTSVGINLNLGFGPQPKAVILNSVANATCLSPCSDPTCDDGFKNGDEDGVDCGGSCPNICPTCTDGVKNGDEDGVDCGGSNCLPCPCNDNVVNVNLNFDNYPEETSWTLQNAGGSTVASGGTYGSQADGSSLIIPLCIVDGCYTFTIFDSYGDGICCGYGNGSYSVTNGSGAVLANGGSFTTSDATSNICFTSSGPCANNGGDSDGDDVCFDVDCDDNDGNIGAQQSPGTACNDNDPNTINDEIQNDGCTCTGIIPGICDNNGGDADGDDVCADVDCDDNDGNIGAQQSPGTACNDNDPNTINDEIQNDGCTCTGIIPGICDNNGGDADGDDVCADVDCDDNDGNIGAQQSPGTACNDNNPNTINDEIQNDGCTCAGTPVGGGPTTIFAHYFETGWDGWADGGSDAYRYAGSRSWEGSYSIRLRDNTNSSVMTSNTYDMSSYASADLEFYFYPNSMENGEDFWVQVNSGSGWQTVAAYASGSSFNNNSFYVATVSGISNLSSSTQFRFRCDASGNGDRVYIDAVTLTGNSGAGLIEQKVTIMEVSSPATELAELASADLEEEEVTIYPNPAGNYLNLEASSSLEQIRIYDTNGSLVKFQKGNDQQEEIDISELAPGFYFISIRTSESIVNKKFVKQ